MDKNAFFTALSLRTVEIDVPGAEGLKMTIRELSAGQRERILKVAKDQGVHTLSALTVALSCPDFEEKDHERLLAEINPEALMAISERIYALSGLHSEARVEAKKD